MQFAASVVPAVPVRKNPAHESEMVNQLLFGEVMEVLGTNTDNWCNIKSSFDGYEGWVHRLQIEAIDNALATVNSSWIIDADSVTDIIVSGGIRLNIPYGSSLLGYKNKQGNFGSFRYEYDGENAFNNKDKKIDSAIILRLIDKWLNTPYLWGGRTMLGVDCSGLTQMIFKMLGINLLRDAAHQATQGVVVDFLQQAQCGDLAFFDDEAGAIYHVGILRNNQEIVHASGKVRVDTFDNAGIINRDSGLRTHKLRIIKRYF